MKNSLWIKWFSKTCSLKQFIVEAQINKKNVKFEIDTGWTFSAKYKFTKWVDVSADVHEFEFDDIILKNVNFLVMDKSCSNNLLGRDLIENLKI